MHQYEVWWAKLPPPAGTRPVVLLSRETSIMVRDFVIVSEVTRTIRNIPTEVILGPEDGLPQRSAVNLDVINTITKDWLTKKICKLPLSKHPAIRKAIRFALDLE